MEFKTKTALTEGTNDQTVASARPLPNAFSYSHLKIRNLRLVLRALVLHAP